MTDHNMKLNDKEMENVTGGVGNQSMAEEGNQSMAEECFLGVVKAPWKKQGYLVNLVSKGIDVVASWNGSFLAPGTKVGVKVEASTHSYVIDSINS